VSSSHDSQTRLARLAGARRRPKQKILPTVTLISRRKETGAHGEGELSHGSTVLFQLVEHNPVAALARHVLDSRQKEIGVCREKENSCIFLPIHDGSAHVSWPEEVSRG
jgi:hypothetical protein